MMLKNEGGNGDIHLQIPKAEEGFGKPEKIIWGSSEQLENERFLKPKSWELRDNSRINCHPVHELIPECRPCRGISLQGIHRGRTWNLHGRSRILSSRRKVQLRST